MPKALDKSNKIFHPDKLGTDDIRAGENDRGRDIEGMTAETRNQDDVSYLEDLGKSN